MKNILFFTHYLVGGGAEKTVVNLAEYMNKTYQDIRAYIGVVYDDETVHAQLDCVRVLKSRTTPQMSKFRKLPIIIRQISELKKLKKELHIDVCISFLPGADFLNVWSKGKEKIVVSVRNKESFFVKNYLRKWYIKFCYNRSDRIIAISEGVKQDIVEYFGVKQEKVQVIYNPVPQAKPSEKTSEKFEELYDKKRIVINIGRLTEQKGQKYLLRAFKIAAERVPDAHLVILGTGELEKELADEIHRLQLQNNVTLMGFVYNPMDYVEKAEVFVFSSIVEGFGNVLLEVMRTGKPIISTDCDFGPRELLAPDTDFRKKTNQIEYAEYGVLVPVMTQEDQSIKMMADAVLQMLGNEQLRADYQKKSAERIKKFEIEQTAKEWFSMLEKL